MIVKCKQKSSRLFEFKIILDQTDKKIGEGQGHHNIELLKHNFRIILPKSVKKLHPDLLALCVLTIVQPWVGKTITFPKKVSKKFAKEVKKQFGFKVVNISSSLQPRKPGKIDSISFSAGFDSTATSVILPKDSIKLMFERIDHPEIKYDNITYSSMPALKALKHFRKAYSAKSDLEYIVAENPQYPTWVALACQCLLLADTFDLRSVNFGTILGSSYVKNGGKYIPHNNAHTRGWGAVFSVVGIPISKPVVGLSEIGTARIVKEGGLGNIALSCPFGDFQKPCMKCFKCFRKTLIGYGVDPESYSARAMRNFMHTPEVIEYIKGEPPLYFQHNIMYALSKLDVSGISLLQAFKEKLLIDKVPVSILNKWYPVSLEQVFPVEMRGQIEKEINKYMETMSKMEIKQLESWDLFTFYKKNRRHMLKGQRKIEQILKYRHKWETFKSIPVEMVRHPKRTLKALFKRIREVL